MNLSALSSRFAVDSSGVASDLNPDLQSLAKSHAESIVEMTSEGVRVPRTITVAYDEANATVSFGESGTAMARPVEVEGLLPSKSVRPWPVANCANGSLL